MNESEALTKLKSIDQSHLMKHWSQLSHPEKLFLLQQIGNLNIETFLKQKALLSETSFHSTATIKPFSNFQMIGSASDKEIGQEAIAKGRLGCLIVAGGQGTRLKLNGPKGLYPISNIKKKSLFQLFSEKMVAAGKWVGRPLHAALMTSPLNHDTTLTYFNTHSFFGLRPQQIDFFSQSMLPFLDEKGNLFLEKRDSIAQGPDGNGSALYHFWLQGLVAKWKNLGIEYVNFIMIDNPLADPFDAELLGFHMRHQNDITIKCTTKLNADEKVGVLVIKDGKTEVIEYMEMPDQERNETHADGTLKYSCANISLFCITLSFIEQLALQKKSLPLHRAFKSAPSLENANHKAWKFEYFIFDMLAYANQVQGLVYPRENCFAPLKNISGPDSPETVQRALQNRDRQIYEELFHKQAPEEPFELSQEFYYPVPACIDLWKNKNLTNDRYLGGI